MSDENNDNSHKPRNLNTERFPAKVILIWLGIICVIISIYLYSAPPSSNHKEWKISDVLKEAEAGNIAEGIIKTEPSEGINIVVIEGKLKPTGLEAVTVGSKVPEVRFSARGRLTDDNLNRLQQTGVFKELPSGSVMKDIVSMLLPLVLFVGVIYFLFVRQMRMAGKGAMSFGKSRAKMLTRDREKVTFKEVAGCDEAKEEVSEIVEFLRDPKKFQKIGGRIPKGVLLVGPPGTGKTLLARAVAGEADVPFFSISGSDFVEMFVGVGAARVRDMFEQGRKSAPCIIFIDEIDAVGRQRGAGLGGGNDEREQTLNSLLVEMDGFDAHEGVIIVAATNRPDVLDSALLRPGRFDRQVTIDLPDITGREEVLRVHAKKITLSKDVDLSVIARNTPGFSGADLANLLNESALLAARYSKKEVDMSDLDEAREKISFGRERRRLMDSDDKKITAYHEAGHAIIQAVVDDGKMPLHKVTIIPRGQALGMAMFMPKKDILHQSKQFLLDRICTGMGGRVAEELVLKDVTSGASSDIRMVTKIARHMVCDWGMSELGPVAYGENQDHIFLGKEITRTQNYSEETARKIDSAILHIVDAQYARARTILLEHMDALEIVTQALLEHETIEGKHVHEVLKYGTIQSEVKPALNSMRKTGDATREKSSKDEEPTTLPGAPTPVPA
ncbi:MAG: ATP-dependent zinc metalloprotease FtsH [Verrucomicrobiota bacterium]|nr:ATP-dependent zinc metalloprotease FtsH [Verrucomicrobiota bacterium]